MICEWCGKSFPHRKGRFCGGCMPPRKKRMAEAVEDAGLNNEEMDSLMEVAMSEKSDFQGAIQEACVPCDVVTDYKEDCGVCAACNRRVLCAIVKADVSPDQVVKALTLLRRVEAGESVEIRKRAGEWPEVELMPSNMWSFYLDHRGGLNVDVAESTFPEAAAAWNGGVG